MDETDVEWLKIICIYYKGWGLKVVYRGKSEDGEIEVKLVSSLVEKGREKRL